jgi:molecular chaperone DnaK (HSP70)
MENSETARYIVGIDLGTTNSAVAFVDSVKAPDRIDNFPVPQLVAAGTVEALDTLPSFHYEPGRDEFDPAAMRLPWQGDAPAFITGAFARDHGMEVPARQIASAKSWLCHGGVDRTADILPWHAAEDVTRLAPATVCAHYLQHIREAWDHAHPTHPLHEQDVIITVPASFDEVARELTVEAAAQAGLKRIVLVEEPQAAFYNWIHEHADTWQETMHAGETILVCDIGGGTTDFTLIQARPTSEGPLQFHRIAVGSHLILGGDNLDLALARFIEQKYVETRFSARQYSVLIRRCRQAKEILLGDNPPEKHTLNLPASGARFIAASQQFELTRAEALQVLLDGFLPQVERRAAPDNAQSGFREFGLPYAADAGITRYLAQFLRDANEETPDAPLRPHAVLLNGGFFASPSLRRRLLDVFTGWFQDHTNDWQPRLLDNARLDLAVARGAAAYGRVRRGEGAKIRAGIPRTYYIGTADQSGERHALCLVPAGLEEGETIEIEQPFEIQIRQPVEFPIYCSAVRTADKPGALITPDPEMLKALPPIRTVLRSGKKKGRATTQVRLQARVNETGTLEVSCLETEGNRSWKLQFDVRSTTQTDIQAHTGQAEAAGFVDSTLEEAGCEIIRDTFEGGGSPEQVTKRIERAVDLSRYQWPPSLLRTFWEELYRLRETRKRTAQHEARWLNLTGFCLRPGYGFAVDDWRVTRTWQLAQQKLTFQRNEQCRGEWWILWRRIAGGLTANQQKELAAPLLAALKTESSGRKNKLKAGAHEYAEIRRLLAALERLDPATRIPLGESALSAMEAYGPAAWNRAAIWSLARLGAREPLYGPLNTLVPTETVSAWIERLLKTGDNHPQTAFALMQMARRTHDRFRDIPEDLRTRVIDHLGAVNAPAHYIDLVQNGGTMQDDEMNQALGDSLPPGLILC